MSKRPKLVLTGDEEKELDELRRTFLVKAFQRRQETLLRRLLKTDLGAEELVSMSLQKLEAIAGVGCFRLESYRCQGSRCKVLQVVAKIVAEVCGACPCQIIIPDRPHPALEFHEDSRLVLMQIIERDK